MRVAFGATCLVTMLWATSAPAQVSPVQPITRPRLAGTPLPTVGATYNTVQVGPYQVKVEQQRGDLSYPYEGIKQRLLLTNTSSQNQNCQVNATIRETGSMPVNEPSPGQFTLAPGETQSVSTVLGGPNGLDALPIGQRSTLTIVWNVCGNTLETPIGIYNWGNVNNPGYQPPALTSDNAITIAGRIVDDKGAPATTASLQLVAATSSWPVLVTNGTFSVRAPKAANWVLTATAPGYKRSSLFLDAATDHTGVTLTLVPQTGTGFTYQSPQIKERGLGIWLGRTTADEGKILLSPGMEIWAPAITPNRADQKIKLYTTDGTKLWEYATGWDAWGADISADGRYVAVSTLKENDFRLILLDGASGQKIWDIPIDDHVFPLPDLQGGAGQPGGRPAAAAYESREVDFSPDGSLIALGGSNGGLAMINRADGSVLWKSYTGGHTRAIKFAADGKTFFVSEGHGNTWRLWTSDGTPLWKATTFAWVHPEGLVVSPDGQRVGVMSYDGDVVMLEASSGRVLFNQDLRQRAWWASFSGDGSVFLAGTQTGGTVGYDAATGDRLFLLGGGKSGAFASGKNFFVLGSTQGMAVYDLEGNRISNILQVDQTFSNFQVAFVSKDGTRVVIAEQQSDNLNQPLLYFFSGTPSSLPK